MASKIRKPALIPATPPGWKGTDNLLNDLNAKYGRRALSDKNVRALIRKESHGKVDVVEIGGEWRLVEKDTQPN